MLMQRVVKKWAHAAGLLVLGFGLAGCQCVPTKCAEGTMVDPDGGGEIVERDNDVGDPVEGLVVGGRCIAET